MLTGRRSRANATGRYSAFTHGQPAVSDDAVALNNISSYYQIEVAHYLPPWMARTRVCRVSVIVFVSMIEANPVMNVVCLFIGKT
jgi:hypothetical protein